MASYQGSPFEAGIGPSDGDIVLFAACPPPEELGFEPATGHWRKQLRLNDVQAVWESRPVGTFRGERCMVLDDLGDRLHIGYLGHDGFRAERLGYWQVDRGVFELVAPRTEVTDISEERTEYRRQVTAPHPVVVVPPPASLADTARATAESASGQYRTLASRGLQAAPASSTEDAAGYLPQAPSLPIPDSSTGVALPLASPAPLPLEAEAMRAASARRPRPTATDGAPASVPPSGAPDQPDPATDRRAQPVASGPEVPPAGFTASGPPVTASSPMTPEVSTSRVTPVADAPEAGAARPRRAARRRMATERLFGDLASLAGIPADSYAVGEDVDGALCLVQTQHGFEVFHSAGGARHELQVFTTEEAACFYLFGVLAAEAVRNGSLARAPATLSNPHA